MRSVHAIRHVHFEDLGVFEGVLKERGFAIRYCDAGIDDMSAIDPLSPDIVAVLGAPVGAYEDSIYPFLADELRILERRLTAERPLVGICLGAQLMARALGARVYPGSAKEIGWSSIQLTREGQNSPLRHLESGPVLHWHGDTFDLPKGAVRLASTPITQNQAFSFGRSALAIQFHPEATGAGFERWLIGHALEIALNTSPAVEQLRRDTAKHAPSAAVRGRRMFEDWLTALP
jgi:GMP synthase (glutamine-hydrolysing)